MIISKSHDFGFVHIPKCAGSTIRQQLRDRDDLGGKFYHTMTLPELGLINGNHVLLEVLERYFPQDLAALREVTSYAIVREPAERFRSAVAQHLRAHVREPAELSEPELRRETDRIIAALEDDPDQRGLRNTIFFRQVDYIHLHGEKLVTHVYPMEDMDALFDRLEQQHGLALERDKIWNPTVTYRVPGTSEGLKRLKDTARRVLPTRTYSTLRDLGVRIFTTRGVPKLETLLSTSDHVQRFIETHYADDIAFYRALRAAGSPA